MYMYLNLQLFIPFSHTYSLESASKTNTSWNEMHWAHIRIRTDYLFDSGEQKMKSAVDYLETLEHNFQ